MHEGVILVKFWLQVSQDEQGRRFEDRRTDPLKQWKLNDEDWRNREKWPQYVEAIEDMFAKTDHELAPWNLVSGEQKKWGRVALLETLNQRIVEGLARWQCLNRPVADAGRGSSSSVRLGPGPERTDVNEPDQPNGRSR